MKLPADHTAMLSQQGYVILFRRELSNACPGCGGCNWNVGRVTAECAFCDTAIPLAEPVRPDTPITEAKEGPE